MSSLVYPVTEDVLSKRRYNLWGAQDKVFPRYPKAMFDGKIPSTKTNPTLSDMKNILFSADDNSKVAVIDLDASVQVATPPQMAGVFPTDGIGNIKTRLLDYNMVDTDKSYPRRILSLDDPMADMAKWDETLKTISLSRQNLELLDTDYPTNVIVSMMVESPHIGMWIAFSVDGKVFYKLQANIYSVQKKRYIEGQTICMPLTLGPDLDWNKTLYVKYRNMGRFIVQLRGVMYRGGTP